MTYYSELRAHGIPDGPAFYLSLLRDVTIEFNKPRRSKRVKAQLIERATKLRLSASKEGATPEQMQRAELVNVLVFHKGFKHPQAA